MNEHKLQEYVDTLTRRYSGSSMESLMAVLCPLLVPIRSLDKTVFKVAGQSHYRASFTVEVTDENRAVLQRGRTGKFIPGGFSADAAVVWREIAKGRIIEVDASAGVASGEVYTGGPQKKLVAALEELRDTDLLEIDQYGASAKVLSGLAEYQLVEIAQDAGFAVRRMPEDMAKHLGAYPNFDFELERDSVIKKVEVKSVWGTNTEYARLIHSTTTRPAGPEAEWTADQRRNYYPTSSCKFETQDIFAVSLFLRTGNIQDFAFARSVPSDQAAYGLPRAERHPEHVHQNPSCQVGDGTWFASIDEVWNLA